MFRIALLLLALFELTLIPVESRANTTNLTREQIRSMPMLERPDRPGHFYGNTVRRINRVRHR